MKTQSLFGFAFLFIPEETLSRKEAAFLRFFVYTVAADIEVDCYFSDSLIVLFKQRRLRV